MPRHGAELSFIAGSIVLTPPGIQKFVNGSVSATGLNGQTRDRSPALHSVLLAIGSATAALGR